MSDRAYAWQPAAIRSPRVQFTPRFPHFVEAASLLRERVIILSESKESRKPGSVSLRTVATLALLLAAAACKPGGPDAGKAASTPALLVSAEDVATIRNNALASGPPITGTIQPERRADVRAEISASVLEVFRENGDVVKHGDLLVRLDDTAIRDALASAQATERSSAQALEQASRQLERVKTLRGSGMASAQALDDAEVRRNGAQSDLEAAKARAVLARQ